MPDRPNPPTAPITAKRLREGVGMYLVGVAIGCILVGLLFIARQRVALQHQPQQQQQMPQRPAPTPVSPPVR